MATRKTGTQAAVFDYMTANADKPISATALASATGFERNSVIGAVNRLMAKFPAQMIAKASGIYVWASKPVAEVETPADATEMLISVLTRKDDGSMLVRDTDGGRVYVMRELDF